MRRVPMAGVAGLLLAGCSRPAPVASGPMPSPSMSPVDVVRTVTAAMQHNDTPGPDSGIAMAFRFASPGNRTHTGPIERFIPMVKSPTYAPLLNCKEVTLGEFDSDDTHARQLVTVTTPAGEKLTYLFGLTRQAFGEFKDCWMTDVVVPVREDSTLPPLPATRPDDEQQPESPPSPAPAPQNPPADSGAQPV